MIIYLFDNTFEGLLTSVFDAYSRRIFPDALLAEGEPLPLFYDESFTVISDEEKSGRVWRGLEKKLSSSALSCLAQCWLAEEPETASLLFRKHSVKSIFYAIYQILTFAHVNLYLKLNEQLIIVT